MSLPYWIKKKIPSAGALREMKELLRSLSLHTVCEEASCPNIGECFSQRTATFMILGDRCTRSCRFCGVRKGNPAPPNPEEPGNIARAVGKLRLEYVVVTSPARDDLTDGGASHFALTIKEIKKLAHEIKVEVLVPDFNGSLSSLRRVIEAGPYVLNHNLETVPHLYPRVRPEADYLRSLELLRESKKLDADIYTKSGLMVGLGENDKEVTRVMKDLRGVGCDILTIGQYLRPSSRNIPVEEYVAPEKFKEYEQTGKSLGFLSLSSSPFVRSSYHAKEIWTHPEKL
jgi:lipoic acid synthetase